MFLNNKWSKDPENWKRNEGFIDGYIPKRGKSSIKRDVGASDLYKFYKTNIKPIKSFLDGKETYGKAVCHNWTQPHRLV